MDGTEQRPRGLNELAQETYGQSLSTRFEMRLVEQARSGRFGLLKSLHTEMRQCFENLARVASQRNLTVFIFGEAGTGKRRVVSEFYSLQNFLDRLDGLNGGQLKILRGDYLQPGFSADFMKLFGPGDFVYIENIETVSAEVQKELHRMLMIGEHEYRLILGTSVALSLRVSQGSFLRELFDKISEVSAYLPSLIDRTEDLTQLIVEFSESMGAVRRLPQAHIVDLLSRLDLPKNLDDLESLVRCLLSKKRDPSTWALEDFPPAFRALLPIHLFSPDGGVAALATRRKQAAVIHRALLEHAGNHAKAARALGVEKTELLQKMMTLGIR